MLNFFPSYFETAWNANSTIIIDKIMGSVSNKKKEFVIKIADEILSEELPKLVDKAITNMLNSNEVSNKEDEKAYSDLLKGINKVYGKDSFSTQLYRLYHMDELKQALLNSIQMSSKKNRYTSLQKN